MILDKVGYAYNDLKIVPAVISRVDSRSQCNPYDENGMLPIFASCMSTVVDTKNYEIFKQNKITPIIPTTIDLVSREFLINEGEWVALSLDEFKKMFIENEVKPEKTYKICVDIANGHMLSLYETCQKAKEISYRNNYTLIIMTGNIANPETYEWFCNNCLVLNPSTNQKDCCIDYIRLSIGTGSQCTTTSNVGTHYPVSSLISECYEIKKRLEKYEEREDAYNTKTIYRKLPKIVADGGCRNFDHVNIALALGADYVMIGGLFAAMYESASPLLLKTLPTDWSGQAYIEADYQYTDEEKKRKDIRNRELWKECYGMSTKKAQELRGKKSTKTAEGKHSILKVQYTLKQWTDNMIDYLKSIMSYCDSFTLEDYIGKQKLIPCSPGTMMSVNK